MGDVDPLEAAITDLIQQHGIHAVWRALHRRGGWCEHCGEPFEEGQHHVWREPGTCELVEDDPT